MILAGPLAVEQPEPLQGVAVQVEDGKDLGREAWTD